MSRQQSFSSVGVSFLVHFIVLGALFFVKESILDKPPEVVVESVFDDERQQEEFSKELETETQIAETQNFMTGGAVSTTAGGGTGGSAAPAVAVSKVANSQSLQEVSFNGIGTSAIALPSDNMIGSDLGVGEVNGEVGAMVEGYGAALSQLTQELIRLMRQERIMVVWLFDESESMKDDQKEIGQKFHKVYEELGIQAKSDKVLKEKDEVLLTAILGFGAGVHEITKEPTTKIPEIQASIEKIPVDESGEENMCSIVQKVVNEYGPRARAQKRRLVLVIVSDESPTDDKPWDKNGVGNQLEPAIEVCEKFKCPVYILGREAIFGYPMARVQWKDPVYNLNHWVWIDRGPETAWPECLQWDGLTWRHDSSPSGFGPYSQVRLAKETGGIFFVLPGEEENIVGRPGAAEARKFAALAMKEYEPNLIPRRDYEEDRAKSKFRTTCWEVILRLNPHIDNKLNLRVWGYPIENDEFKTIGTQEFEKVTNIMGVLNQAIGMMDDVRPLRAKEDSQRWRAAYDLIYAQCVAYRTRMFQYLVALDDHATKDPKRKDVKDNRWDLHAQAELRMPTDEQFERIKKSFGVKEKKDEYLAKLESERQRAISLFEQVKKDHPGTPWAARAEWDKNRGWGYGFHSLFWDPKYNEVGKRIKVPKF